MRGSTSSIPLAVLGLALFNLYPTILLLRVQAWIWSGRASVGNAPAVRFLWVVAALYLVSSIAFLLRRKRVGIAFCLLGMAAAVADVAWIWSTRFVVTLDIALQLFQVVLCAIVLSVSFGPALRVKRPAA